ncbi:MAG: hypothetical protein DRJ56_00930 [Thermoprotei archaeon]|nr:MAG: hypothetical protein DRJ56_00930 [Thermoprotei archaeon]
MPRRFCALCGRVTNDLYRGLCAECYLSQHPLAVVAREPSLTLCRSCLAYLRRGRWHYPRAGRELEGVLEGALNALRDALRPSSEAVLVSVEPAASLSTASQLVSRGRAEVPVVVRGRISPSSSVVHEQVLHLRVEVKWALCPACRRVRGRVERAILQVRVYGRLMSEGEKKRVMEVIAKEAERLYDRDREAVILESDLSEGVDVYLSSKRVARALAAAVQRRFGGRVLETQKVVGVDGSGRVSTKSTVRVLLPPFRTGDVIVREGRAMVVREVRGNRYRALPLDSCSVETLPLSEAFSGRVRVVSPSEVERASVLSVSRGYVQLMSMRNYRVYEVRAEVVPSWVRVGGEVGVLRLGEKVYFVPLN